MRNYAVMLLSGLLIAGCSTAPQHWEDARYGAAMDTGRTVFESGYMGQAALKYKTALQRAFVANDPQAIHDAGYNLATAQLRQGQVEGALATLDRVSAALQARNWQDQADLSLIRSSALYQQKQWARAEHAARVALKSDDETRAQAFMFIGLNAAELGQNEALQEAIAHLESRHDAVAQANCLELRAHQFLIQRQWKQAAQIGPSLAQMRKQQGDYPAMRRALTIQEIAYSAVGDRVSAQRVRQQIRDSQTNEQGHS